MLSTRSAIILLQLMACVMQIYALWFQLGSETTFVLDIQLEVDLQTCPVHRALSLLGILMVFYVHDSTTDYGSFAGISTQPTRTPPLLGFSLIRNLVLSKRSRISELLVVMKSRDSPSRSSWQLQPRRRTCLANERKPSCHAAWRLGQINRIMISSLIGLLIG